MLAIPTSDIYKIGIVIGLLGAFILAKNYFPISVEQASLEGRLQFSGNSFDIKNKIIGKYNAWVGFGLIIISAIIQFGALHLEKYTTWNDLKGRTVLFSSIFNTVTTIAFIFLILRLAIFITDYGARREYFGYLKEREKNNFQNDVRNLNNNNPEFVREAQRGIDQQLLLFDLKLDKNTSYDVKIQKLKEEVFKE